MNLLTYVHLRNIYRSTGVGRVGRELTERLARQPGITQKILADPYDYARIIEQVGAPWTKFDYRFFQHDTSRQQMLWYLLNRPAAEMYWPEADVVYCTAESYVPTRRARLAVTSHDMQIFEPEAHPPSRWRTQQRFKWRRMFHRLQRRAAMFLTVSRFSAERLERYFPGVASRIRIVPNAVCSDFFSAPERRVSEETLAALAIKGNPYVLIPGGLHFRKNANLILEAWPKLQARAPELRLVVLGHNDPVYVDRAKALHSPPILTGFLEEQQMIALYRSAQLVWFPSRYEGFGMPVIEAMACGAPVVTCETASLPEICGGAAAALLSPDRPEDHIDAIAALLASSTDRSRASDLGRIRARQFTWERSADLLLRALQELT